MSIRIAAAWLGTRWPRTSQGLLLLVLTGLVAALTAAPARAQCVGGNNPPMTLTLFTVPIGFPSPGPADFNAGWIDDPDPFTVTMETRGNQSWAICIRAETGDLGGGKLLDDLRWSRDGGPPWNPMTTIDQTVATGVGNQTITMYFRMLLHWATDAPGTYGTTLTFTAVRP